MFKSLPLLLGYYYFFLLLYLWLKTWEWLFRNETKVYKLQQQQTAFINVHDNLMHINNDRHANISKSQNAVVWSCLSLAMHLQSVAAFPASATRAADRLAVAVTFAEAAWLARSWSESTHLTMLHHRLAQPLNVGIVTDGCMEWIHTHHLKEFVRRVLSNPVAVQNPQCFALAANTLLSIKTAQ